MLDQLIREFGEDQARSYLLEYFRVEENLPQFLSLFPNHFPPGYGIPPHQWEMLNTIPQYSRLCFAAPRGGGKSTTIDIAVIAFYALNGISRFSLLVSDSADQANAHLDALKAELETNPLIQWLYGNVVGSPWGAGGIVVRTPNGEAKILSRGRGQKIRGLRWRRFRPALAVVDDLENDEMMDSPTIMRKGEHWFRFNFLRGLAKDWNTVVMLGTILGENALLKQIIDGDDPYKGWETRLYKALRLDGTSYWPEMFPKDWLESIRDDPSHPSYAGSLVFAQEYQNEPRSDRDRVIQPGWIKYYSYGRKIKLDPEWLKTGQIVSAADLAIAQTKTSHLFANTVALLDDDGHYWVLDIARGKFTVDEQADKILDAAERWGVEKIGIENNAYQEALRQLVVLKMGQRGIHRRVLGIKTDRKKERRALTHSAKFEGGFVHLPKDHPNTAYLVNEIDAFPAEPDDTFDSLLLLFDLTTKGKPRVFARKPKAFR